MIARLTLLFVALLLGGAARAATASDAVLILISLDGFRWDYCDLHPGETPNLRRLMREGVSARGLVPVFPSNTFPNHYSIVTGLYPAHHGIINNYMFDPRTGEFFRYNTAKSAREPQWWGGEPIWITAVEQGRASACSHWPGSEAPVRGKRPTYWRPFDYFNVSFEARLDTMIHWLTQPAAQRPAVVTFYIEEGNAVGHDYGPDSPQLIAALAQIDTQVGALQARVAQAGVAANLVIVSDHGMTAVSPERLLILDDYLDLSTVLVDHTGSTVGLRPLEGGDLSPLQQALAAMPHVRVCRAEDLPERFRLRDNARISPLWILPEEGWRVDTRALSRIPRKSGVPLGGDHGYDPALLSMHGILVANGPAFRSDGAVVPAVENVHVYNLLCAVLGLTPAPNDGDDRLVRAFLKP